MFRTADSRPDPVRLCRTHSARRGSLLAEMIVCTILLSTVMLVLAPALVAVQQQRQATRFEMMTLIELNNIATHLQAGTDAASVQLSEWFVHRYSDAHLQIEPPEPPAKATAGLSAMRVTISRPATDGLPDTHRSLVLWQAEDAE